MINAISESWHRKAMTSLANPDRSFRVGTEEGLLVVLTWMNHIVQQELSWGSTYCKVSVVSCFRTWEEKRHHEAGCPSRLGSSGLRRFSLVFGLACQGTKGDTIRHGPTFHQSAGAVVNTAKTPPFPTVFLPYWQYMVLTWSIVIVYVLDFYAVI